jgi:hypothetical protein
MSITAEDTVAEILNAEITPAQVMAARRFVESFQFTTGALFAIEVALREQYGDAEREGCAAAEGAPLADLLATIIRQAAAIEATEI